MADASMTNDGILAYLKRLFVVDTTEWMLRRESADTGLSGIDDSGEGGGRSPARNWSQLELFLSLLSFSCSFT